MADISIPTAAIFIDGDWLHYTSLRIKTEVDYITLKEALHESYGNDAPIYFFGSYDPQDKEQVHFLESLEALGYIVIVAKLRKIKEQVLTKGVDVNLAVHASLLPAEIKTIVLISGDGDFVPLVEQLILHGKQVLVITMPTASRALVNASSRNFIHLEKLLARIKAGMKLPNMGVHKERVVPPKNWYIAKGEYYAPYLAIRELFMSATREVIIIDSYVNDQVLHMIHPLPVNVGVNIITNRISPADFCVQVAKLRSEGYRISIRKTSDFHDRFLSVDGEWWHSGHSFKDLGGKDSLVNRIEDENAVRKLNERVQHQLVNGGEYCV